VLKKVADSLRPGRYGFPVERDAMPGGIGQGGGELVGIEVEHTDRIAASDIDPAVDAVGRDVVDPTGGGNLRGGNNFIGRRREVGAATIGERLKNAGQAEVAPAACCRLREAFSWWAGMVET